MPDSSELRSSKPSFSLDPHGMGMGDDSDSSEYKLQEQLEEGLSLHPFESDDKDNRSVLPTQHFGTNFMLFEMHVSLTCV